jgi:ferredoxin-NADP reductase
MTVELEKELICLEVAGVFDETPNIRTFDLVACRDRTLPPFTAGAHIIVHLPGGYERQYSLSGDPADSTHYRLGVLNLEDGRGGSRSFHEQIKAGDSLNVSLPRNHFGLAETAQHFRFIAGGIGLTPFMSMIPVLEREGRAFHLDICTRARDDTPFLDELDKLVEQGVATFHHDGGNPENGLQVEDSLREVDLGLHVYCCGPMGLMKAVRKTSRHWPRDNIHFELFGSSQPAPKATT